MATENGCFAKTFGLNPDDEPTIYGAVTQPDSYLENVSQHGEDVDFYDTSYTPNGRAASVTCPSLSATNERESAGASLASVPTAPASTCPTGSKTRSRSSPRFTWPRSRSGLANVISPWPAGSP